MRKLSLAQLTILDADPLTLIEAASAGGFDMVGLRVVAPLPSDTIVPIVGDVPLKRRLKERLSATGVSVLDIEAIWVQPETDVAQLRPALEVGAELGAKHVLTVGFDEDEARLTDNFGAFFALSQDCGLRAMLEFIPYSTIPTLRAAHDLLIKVRPANAGLLVDALHLSRSGGHPRDIAQYNSALFSYVHLCDATARVPPKNDVRREAREGRLYPGEGELWLDEFLNAFPVGTPAGVEAPNRALSDLAAAERARRCGNATRDLLARRGET